MTWRCDAALCRRVVSCAPSSFARTTHKLCCVALHRGVITPRVAPYANDDDDNDTCAPRYAARACVGGIAAWAHDALGPGWVDADGKGATVQDAKAIADVAQRSLGDVFEQLERIGAFGRERCRGYGYGPISPALRVHRDEAIKLINLADLALSYARVHLTYLEPAPLDGGGVVTDALDENTSPAP